MKKLLIITCCLFIGILSHAQIITTVAGSGDGDGYSALTTTLTPHNIEIDKLGNIFIADKGNQRIWKVTAATGLITTIAGVGSAGYYGDGSTATSAELNNPSGVALDTSGNIYIADNRNYRIRKVTVATGIITTVAGNGIGGYSGDGGAATSAQILDITDITTDISGNIYLVDSYNQRIRKVTASTGIITTIAGNGIRGFSGDGSLATTAQLYNPMGLAIDNLGNIYIADLTNQRIRKVTAATGIITTVAGNGTWGFSGDEGSATSAQLQGPSELAVDNTGNIYIVDQYNHRIRKVSAATGIITTVAGNGPGYSGDGSAATSAQLLYPTSVAVDVSGNIYIADNGNYSVRKVSANTGIITTVAGKGNMNYSGDGGTATLAGLNSPSGLALDIYGNIYVADALNHRIRKITATSGIITTIAGNGVEGYSGDESAATSAQLSGPWGVAVDASGNIFIVDKGNHRIRKVTATTGIITTVAGNGTWGLSGDEGAATFAQLRNPTGVAVDALGNIYIADNDNSRIRKVTAATGIITTIAGNGSGYSGDEGVATTAKFNNPRGVAVDISGNIYIVDLGNQRIRKVTAATGIITTIAGNGIAGYSGDGGTATLAKLNNPSGVAVDISGNIYIAEYNNQRIRKVTSTTGIITTVTGNGIKGFSGDGSAAISAQLNSPMGVAVDASGNIYIADFGNQRIRKVTDNFTPPLLIIYTSVVNSNHCSGNTISIPFTVSGTFNAGNIFTAQLSDASGSFASPVNIGTINSTIGGSINAVIPANTIQGSFYRIRVISSNPSVTGNDNGSNIAVHPKPTVTASATSSTLCSGNSTILNGGGADSYVWTGGINDGVGFIPTASGFYTVTGTDAYGCSNYAAISIILNQLPKAPISGGDQAVLANSTAILSATPYGGSNVDWYSAISGGLPLISNSNTYSTSTTGTYYAESRNPNTGCKSSYRTPIILSTLIIWNGTSWSGGVPPVSSESVLITGPYTVGSDLSVANLTVAGGGSLTVDPGKTLTASGSITIGSNATINGNISASSIDVGATGNMTLNSGSTLTTTGNLTINSNGTGDGSLINNGTITGAVSVQRYIPANSWHLLSSSVASANTNVFTGLYLRQYDEGTDAFGANILATNIALTPGTGDLLWSDSPYTISFNGALNNGNVGPLPCDYTLNGFNLMGNPYPSAIDWNAASGWAKTNLSSTIWVWSQTAGQYATWINSLGNDVLGPNNGSQYIAMGEGFFVKATAIGASLTMTKAVQVHNGISLLKSASTKPALIRVRVSGNKYSDELILLQANDAQSGIDYKYDAQKMKGLSAAPQLYTTQQNKKFSIFAFNNIDTTLQIPVCLNVGKDTSYKLTLQNLISANGIAMYLHDKLNNTLHEVKDSISYTFEASPSSDSDRFVLLFRTKNATGIKQVNGNETINVWTVQQQLFLNVPNGEAIKSVALYDLNGRKLQSWVSSTTWPVVLHFSPSIYVVNVITNKQISKHKILIK